MATAASSRALAMGVPARKIVIKGRRPATKGDNGNAAYMARRREEAAHHRFMCSLLIRWGRGFSIEDAPPAINEWTPRPSCGIMAPVIDR